MALNFLGDAVSEVRTSPPQTEDTDLRVLGAWEGEVYLSRLVNGGEYPVAVGEVVLFSGTLPMGPDTPIYGEGFQMLSQYAGSLGSPEALGPYTDCDHYRLRQIEGARTVYSLLMLSPSREEHQDLGPLLALRIKNGNGADDGRAGASAGREGIATSHAPLHPWVDTLLVYGVLEISARIEWRASRAAPWLTEVKRVRGEAPAPLLQMSGGPSADGHTAARAETLWCQTATGEDVLLYAHPRPAGRRWSP